MMSYFAHLGVLVLIYVILAASFNLAIGYGGLINLGHIAFYAIGAYASALLVMNGVPFFAAMITAGMLAALFGIILAVSCARIRGDYLAMTTLGFGFIVDAVLKNWISLTRGALGLPGIPKPSLFGFTFSGLYEYLFFTLLITVFVVYLIHRIVGSGFGKSAEAVRDDEVAAQSIGIDSSKVKVLVMGLSAFFAGIAGSIYAHYITFISPSSFSVLEVILILSIVVIGGLASTKGSIFGAALLILLPEPLRYIGLPSSVVGPVRQMLFSLILILIIYYRPKGLFGRVDLNA